MATADRLPRQCCRELLLLAFKMIFIVPVIALVVQYLKTPDDAPEIEKQGAGTQEAGRRGTPRFPKRPLPSFSFPQPARTKWHSAVEPWLAGKPRRSRAVRSGRRANSHQVVFYNVRWPYSSRVVASLIAAIASVIVITITVIGQWINSRNDRNLTNQERMSRGIEGNIFLIRPDASRAFSHIAHLNCLQPTQQWVV